MTSSPCLPSGRDHGPAKVEESSGGNSSVIFRGTSKPYTRWWWLAGPYRHEDIVYQLDWLKANGFGGVELAWLWPSWLGPSAQDAMTLKWLSPEWAELIAFSKRYAEQIGLGCDFTFGSCWPFGGSGVRPEDASQTFAGASSQQLHGSWETPSEEPLLVLDHLRRPALEHYAATLLPAFAAALTGEPSALFCDSLELDTRDWWSPGLWQQFARRFGYSLEPLVRRLPERPDVRYDYRKFLAEAMHREFFVAFTEICHRAGALSRVQCHGSLTDLLAAYAAVDIPESEAILFNPWFSRIAASAAALAGRPVVSCETFTCIYGFITVGNIEPIYYWRKENVADLKLLADALFAHGINHVIWHGMPFNGPGGKREFYASVHVGPDAHYAKDLPAFNAYLERVSRHMRAGRPCARLAVYLPVEDNWMQDRIPAAERTPAAVYRWELRHVTVPAETEGYAPLWVSMSFLKGATVQDSRLCVGPAAFDGLYLDSEWLDAEALLEILRLARAGLPIVCKRRPQQPGAVPRDDYQTMLQELEALPNVKPSLAETGLRPLLIGDDLPYFWARESADRVWLFFAHPAARAVRYPMRYGQAHEAVENNRRVTIDLGEHVAEVELRFQPHQSLLASVDRRSGAVEYVDISYTPPEPARA